MEILENNKCQVIRKSNTMITSENKTICDECYKEFASANSLWAHKKRYHCGDPPLKCNICSKPFYVLFRLTSHLKKKHHLGGDNLEKCLGEHGTKWNILCYAHECQQRFRRMNAYLIHLSEKHGANIHKEDREFNTVEEFNHWFETNERYNNSHYVQHRGERPDKNHIKSKYLFCHRSGFARVRPVKGERKGRKRNTCKMSGYCSSFMEVNQYPDESVKVKYYTTHVGHGTTNEEDIQHLPIPQSEKEHIAGLLLQGVSKHDIIKSYSEESVAGSRMSYLRSHDIGNIKVSFHMDTDEGLRMYQEHKNAMDLVAKIVQQDTFVFTVPSSIRLNKQYIVKKQNDCYDKKCQSRCLLCQACIHSLICECEMANNYACKHVHAVNMWCKFQRQHRLFYEHDKDELELSGSMVDEGLSPNYEEYSAKGIFTDKGMESKSSLNQEYVDEEDTELENVLEEAKILLVELIALIEECKDFNAVTRFIELLNKTKKDLTSKGSIDRIYTEYKRKTTNLNKKSNGFSRNITHNSKQKKCNVIEPKINENMKPIKIITKPKKYSSQHTQETQYSSLKMASNFIIKSSDNKSKLYKKNQSSQSKGIPVKASQQKVKKLTAMSDSKDTRFLMQENNNFQDFSMESKVKVTNNDQNVKVLNGNMERQYSFISQTNMETQSQPLVPSSAKFIEENNLLLNSFISNDNFLPNTGAENIKLTLRVNDNKINLPRTSPTCSSIQEDNIETVRKIRTFVKNNEGQVKEFFFKVND